jgi:hypothetical protein
LAEADTEADMAAGKEADSTSAAAEGRAVDTGAGKAVDSRPSW